MPFYSEIGYDDPALSKATIETFIDKSDVERVQEKSSQWNLCDSTPQ